ncbi:MULTISPECIES: hydrogenase maturation protease [unclassified Streptomyces]|uniref:hydrogenase maturation protease n=1 Tax=unclassified Streptomyces TaxID=2593676 RepID=UPI002E280409|nr:hydrogenase maturation protease [Streptomyces sp. NBC_00223]
MSATSDTDTAAADGMTAAGGARADHDGARAAGAVLVAGVGNLFLGDDGFGPEVVRRLAGSGGLPPQIRVTDYGIRGMHLAYDLLDGYDALILVDAYPGDGPPGRLTVLEIGAKDLGTGEFDAHGMNPVSVLANMGQLGGILPLTYLVGCTPAGVEEGIGLSEAVSAAVPEAVEAVRTLVRRLVPAEPAETRSP